MHDAFDELSREFRLVTDAAGAITWRDERAGDLGISVGGELAALALEGCDDKVHELVRRGRGDVVRGWECALVLGGKPLTVVFSARPRDDGVALLGSLVSQDDADAVAEGARAIDEIVLLNRELAKQKRRLEDSNIAIRALHTELEHHADVARASAELKARLVASVSHEFRTPLHSILGLSGLLLGEADGPLEAEQRKQVELIRESARELSAMVNDMLDLAKLEGGTPQVRTQTFEVRELLAAISGTMRPLVPADAELELIFDPAPDIAIETDHDKLSQIVRNLISNAIKFTERGTVRVTARVDGDHLEIAVADSGIGIPADQQERIFEEFVQLESSRQREVRGTGLGLPLARKLATALAGRITVRSIPMAGSTFTLAIPIEHPEIERYRKLAAAKPDPELAPVLVVEGDRATVFVYEQYLSMAGFQVLPARTIDAARELLQHARPSAILLDIMLDGEDTWSFLAELKRDQATRDIPVLVCTVMNRESRARALGADEFWFKPVDEDKLIRKLQTIAAGRGARVLVIDDDPAACYIIKKYLQDTPYEVHEALEGNEGLDLARTLRPDIILLDFLLDRMTAFDVLDSLKADPRTRHIPVIIVTSQALPFDERQRLAQHTEAILSKEHLSRELAITRIRDALRNAGIREAGR